MKIWKLALAAALAAGTVAAYIYFPNPLEQAAREAAAPADAPPAAESPVEQPAMDGGDST